MRGASPLVGLVGAGLLAGCSTNAPSKVVDGAIDAAMQFNLGFLLGFSVGVAGLDLTYADGTTDTVTVLLVSGFKGMLLEATFSFGGGELTVPQGGVDRSDLFAPYDGRMWGVTLGVGMRRETLSNFYGVGLQNTGFSIGATGFTGEETLYVFPL